MDVVLTERHQKWIEKSRLMPYLVAYIRSSPSLARRAFKIGTKLRAVNSRYVFLPERDMHITLKEFGFLGDDVKPKNFSKVLATVEDIASKSKPFKIRVGGVGIFPSVIYGRIEKGASEIRELNRKLVKELGDLVMHSEYDGENMKPHITLLHFAVGDVEPLLRKARSLAANSIGEMVVREIQVAKWYPYRLFGTKRERESVREILATYKLGRRK